MTKWYPKYVIVSSKHVKDIRKHVITFVDTENKTYFVLPTYPLSNRITPNANDVTKTLLDSATPTLLGGTSIQRE